jgi:hypothetical protein
LPRSPRLQRGRGNADLLPSPWSACKRRKRERERRMGKARVNLAEFKFKFEFLQTRFENLPKIVSRGFKHGKEVMAKV